MSGEPLLTYLMPLYCISAYVSLLIWHPSPNELTATTLPTAVFGTLWAAFNIYRTKSLDLGVVTMGIVAIAGAIERGCIGPGPPQLTPTVQLVQTIGCILVAINYILPLLAWNEITSKLGRKKTALWFAVFFWYCLAFAIFWLICAYKSRQRNDVVSGGRD